MEYLENIPLSTLTTIRLGGRARYVVEIASKDDLVAAVYFAKEHDVPWFVLGGGSNVVALDDYSGLIILNRIKGFSTLDEDEHSVICRIGAGEVWDLVVKRLSDAGLSGIEAMSAIPGYAGSTPIQNVGAYGQEIADTLIELEVYDTKNAKFVTMSTDDCSFSYRNSVFKDYELRHHIITSITLRLNKTPLTPPFYPSLAQYLDENAVTDFSPANIRRAVTAIRADKLPDPLAIASAGSFFKNPIVDGTFAEEFFKRFPDAPYWDMPEGGTKLAAGWLLEQAGLKSYSAHGLQLYPKNALVVINLSAKSTNDLEKFKFEVVTAVEEKFGITLEQEPESLGAVKR